MEKNLNSEVSATTTHRRSKEMSDGTDTQMISQTVDKCRVKMIQRELYNVMNPLWGRETEKRRVREGNNLVCIGTHFLNWLREEKPPRIGDSFIVTSVFLLKISQKIILTVIKLTRAQFFNPFSTNLLTWVHWAKIPYYLGLSLEIVTLQLVSSVGKNLCTSKYNGYIW